MDLRALVAFSSYDKSRVQYRETHCKLKYLDEVFQVPPTLIHMYGLPNESTYVCHCPTAQRTIAVPAFEHAHDASPSINISKMARVKSKSVIETCRDLSVMARHAWILVFTGIETTAVSTIYRGVLDMRYDKHT